MYNSIPSEFSFKIKKIFGKDIKIITDCCNRSDMSCCGGGGGCCNSMFINVNNYCNSNCYFCISGKGKNEVSNFIKLEDTIDELIGKDVISKVVLTGGEPTLHPKFTKFLSVLDKKKLMWYSLNTNGILLNKFIKEINESKLKHINISTHHYDQLINKKIMVNCLDFNQIKSLRDEIGKNIEIRLACTITKYLYKEKDIMKYIEKAKSIGVNNVIFRNEYKGFNKYLEDFRRIWGDLFTADICNCGYKFIKGVNAEYRESNVKLKQAICEANTYFRDFIYHDNDTLSGSWEYGSQLIS